MTHNMTHNFRTTSAELLEEDVAKVDLYKNNLWKLEEQLGHEDIEMYIRQMKMELRCARSIADEQVHLIESLKIHLIEIYILAVG